MPRRKTEAEKKATTKSSVKKRPPENWRDIFIEVLASTGYVVQAAVACGMDRGTIYQIANREPEFSARWEAALQQATRAAEETLYTQAISGADTTALIFLLKCRKRAVYGDKQHIQLDGTLNVKAEDLTDDALAAVVLAGTSGGGTPAPTPSPSEP